MTSQRSRLLILLSGLALGASSLPALALAQAPVAPAAAPAADYEVKGFRSAKFGMTQAQVRAALATDFPGAKVVQTANVSEGTEAIQAAVDKLDPGPGPATVTYIFGATSKTLTHINVIWNVAEPTTQQRDGIVAAAIQITNYFQSMPVQPKSVAGPTPLAANALLMYGAVDKRGAGMAVAVSGIAYQAQGATPATPAPQPTGPAALRISYIANVANPDILRIKAGSF